MSNVRQFPGLPVPDLRAPPEVTEGSLPADHFAAAAAAAAAEVRRQEAERHALQPLLQEAGAWQSRTVALAADTSQRRVLWGIKWVAAGVIVGGLAWVFLGPPRTSRTAASGAAASRQEDAS